MVERAGGRLAGRRSYRLPRYGTDLSRFRKFNLNIGDRPLLFPGIRRPYFEVAGIGGDSCIISSQTGLDVAYEPGTGMGGGRLLSMNGCEKDRYYLAHEEEREAIARRAHARTLRGHTWSHRLAAIVLAHRMV